jgi:hypothetical protein
MPEDKKVQIVEGTSTVRRSLFFSSIGEVVEWFDFVVYRRGGACDSHACTRDAALRGAAQCGEDFVRITA